MVGERSTHRVHYSENGLLFYKEAMSTIFAAAYDLEHNSVCRPVGSGGNIQRRAAKLVLTLSS